MGRIAAKGLADELNDRPYLVVDGLDGRGHYVPLPTTANLAELPIGGVVEVRPVADSVADRNITALAQGGLYLPKRHLDHLRGKGQHPEDAGDVVAGHVRRLEALRRSGIVERVADGLWRVPADVVDKGKAYDRRRLGGVELELHSHLSIEKQVRVLGATWLDRQLLEGGTSALPSTGFAGATREAVVARADFLVEQGLAEKRNQRVFLANNVLNTLREREIADVALKIQRDTGLPYRPVKEGTRVSGVYRRSIVLASGRFAMLSDGLGFALVPWRPVIEKALGRTVSAVVRENNVSWHLGRQRGLSL